MNTLSKPKVSTRQRGNSLIAPVFGAPTRSPRTPTPSTLCSYSDTFEDGSGDLPDPSFVKNSDSISDAPTNTVRYSDSVSDAPTNTVRYSDSVSDEDLYSDTFVDATATKRSITEKIITEILEEETEKPETYTSFGPQQSYSETFESTRPGDYVEYSRSSTADTQTFHSDQTRTEWTESATGVDSSSGSIYGDKTHYDDVSDNDDTFDSGREFEEEITKTYDYSYTFEPTEDTSYSRIKEEEEELRRQEEEALNLLSVEAEDDFASAMVFSITQRPYKQYIQPEKVIVPEKVDKHFAKFKMKKLKLLKEKLKEGKSEPACIENLQQKMERESKVTDYGLDPSVVERLKMRNIMEKMEKAVNEPIHIPKHCKKCKKHQTAIEATTAERDFIRSKTTSLRRHIIEDQIHHHLVKMDSINLIAEISKSLPRPTEDPEIILDKLHQGLCLSKSVDNRLLNT